MGMGNRWRGKYESLRQRELTMTDNLNERVAEGVQIALDRIKQAIGTH